MIQSIPIEITIASFSIIGILTGYIWNMQGKKIDDLKKAHRELPCLIICSKIDKILTDIEWLKKSVHAKKW